MPAPSGLVDQVRSLVGPQVDAVERSLVAELGDCPPYLRDAALSVLRRGGKRLRPYLHLLASDLCGHDASEHVVRFATVVEYLHVASLVHDDVIDESELRRGSPTLNQVLGNTQSVLVGDYLCVKALGLAGSFHRADIHELVVRTTLDLIEGESLQEAMVGRLDVTEAECLRAIELKTGRLMACACEAAAVFAHASDEWRGKLREYGLRLGLAFQLADDVLDFVSDEVTLGKPVLNDLREGKLSMPALHALEHGDVACREAIARVVRSRSFDGVEPHELVAAVRRSGAVDATMQIAERAAADARTALDGLPPSPALDALLFATEYAIARTF